MLFKFKSKSTADLIMLEPHGRRVLELVGKTPQAHGILTVDQMPQAMAALEQAVRAEEAHWAELEARAEAEGEAPPARPEVGLRQRTTPFIDMLKRAHAAGHDVVWGV